MKINKNFVIYTFITILVIFLDQISKFIVSQNKILLSEVIEINDFLNLVYVENKGITFGIFSDLNISFYLGILSFLISIYIILLIRRSVNKLESLSLSLILGGAIGNGIDRVYNNYVIDFIDFYYSQYHWPAFNFADSFITIGALGFFVSIILHK